MNKVLKYPLHLQFFAEDDNEGTGTGDNNQDKNTDEEVKTFTQEEVDSIVEKRLAREKSKKDDDNEDAADKTVDETTEVNPYLEKYAQAEIKVAMTLQGIDATKVARAVRLIDHNTVLEVDGNIDVEKLNTAIAELLEEWPELGPSAKEDNKNFKIGADNNKDQGSDDNLIAKAFGNEVEK